VHVLILWRKEDVRRSRPSLGGGRGGASLFAVSGRGREASRSWSEVGTDPLTRALLGTLAANHTSTHLACPLVHIHSIFPRIVGVAGGHLVSQQEHRPPRPPISLALMRTRATLSSKGRNTRSRLDSKAHQAPPGSPRSLSFCTSLSRVLRFGPGGPRCKLVGRSALRRCILAPSPLTGRRERRATPPS